VQANVALKRPQEAVRRFEACRKLLSRDLGVEPTLDLLRAYQNAQLSL
jgi:DNA-binding SARP family transcriptional activator